MVDDLRGSELFQLGRPHRGNTVSFELAIPDNPALSGAPVRVRGVILGAPGPERTNTLETVIGR